MDRSNRVIANTGFLYINMIVTMLIQFFSVRIVLNALGETDYGIYSVVAGVVTLFSFINVAMAAATQRYLSYAIGEEDLEKLKTTFYYSVVLHIAIGIAVLLMLEVGGIYYIENFLNAPQVRISSAKILMHCIAFSTFVNIITVPYEADINANENMGVIASINIFDSFLKLATAYIVLYSSTDKLVLFGVLTMASMCLTLIIKRLYCLHKYSESHVKIAPIKDKKLLREMFSFATWNLIGTGCGAARYQGTGMILNYFFGIAINAAYGISQYVNGLLVFFSNTIVRAIRPQIVKSEGAGDRERMLRLSETTCKITTLMVALLSVPLLVVMDSVLSLWLGGAQSDECVMFCKSFLLIVLINQMSIGLSIAVESEGKIRLLQMILGSMHIIALPIGYVCFKFGCPPSAIMICIILEETLGLLIRTAIAKRQTGLNAYAYLRKTVLPCVTAIIVSYFITDGISDILEQDNDILRIAICMTVNFIVLCPVSYLLILTKAEKASINKFIASIRSRLLHKQ